jgi:hypothetical protein
MKKHKKDLIKKLDKIIASYKDLDSTCDQARELGCLEVEGKLFNSIWMAFEGMIDLIDDENRWISWYIWDNECGERGLKAGGLKKIGMKPIKTTKDLAELILS